MSRICLPLSASAALMASTALADVPSVTVDIAPVHSLVAKVMDGVGTPNLVIPAGASPHEYSLRPSEAAALQDADVVFWMGHDLSPFLEDAIETLAEGAAVTSLLEADDTMLLDFRENALFEAHEHGDHDDHDDHGHEEHADEHGHDDHDHDHEEHAHDDHDDHDHEEHAHDDHGHDDHGHEEHAHDDHDHDHDHASKEDDHDHEEHAHDDHGHHHGAHDPHAWLSLDNARTWLDLIAAQLSVADPDNAGAYFSNAATAKAEMDALETEVAELLAPAAGGSFIVFHDAYQYFETTFDFPASGAISIGDAQDPSPARIAEIQGRIQNEGVDCVLSEPQFNPGLVATVLDGTPASTGVLDPLGSDLTPGPDLYPQLIRNLGTTLVTCLTSEG